MLTAVLVFTACNNQAKQEALQKAKQVTIDSINAVAAAKQHIADSMHTIIVRQHTIDSMEAASRASSMSSSQSSGQATPAKKKGWSNTAKGAVIGAGVGAVTGVLVDGKKGEGAIVGGLIGAGTGAGVGAIIDGKKKKKSGQ